MGPHAYLLKMRKQKYENSEVMLHPFKSLFTAKFWDFIQHIILEGHSLTYDPKTNKIFKMKIYNAHMFDIFRVTIVASINH